MRLRSVIRTISASLTTAIIVSCNINGEPEGRQVTDYQDYSMGEPAWTEYALIEEISKEAKASENVPDNFIPEWFFEIVLIWMILHIK